MKSAVSIQETEFAAFSLLLESLPKQVNNSAEFTASASGHYDERDCFTTSRDYLSCASEVMTNSTYLHIKC